MNTASFVLSIAMAVLSGGQTPASAEDTNAVDVAYSEAQFAVGERDCARAVRHLREVLAARPDRWDVHRLAGDCLMKLGRPIEARDHYREWARLRPEDDDATAAAQKADDAERELDSRRDAREREKQAAVRPETRPTLADASRQYRRLTPSKSTVYTLVGDSAGDASTPPIPADALVSVVEAMRQRAESILRPVMRAVAADARQLTVARRRYADACEGKTASRTLDGLREGHAVEATTHHGSTGRVDHTWSEWAWIERWRTRETQHNAETVECRALASDIDRVSESLSAARASTERELGGYPAVYPRIREEVFARLAAELW